MAAHSDRGHDTEVVLDAGRELRLSGDQLPPLCGSIQVDPPPCRTDRCSPLDTRRPSPTIGCTGAGPARPPDPGHCGRTPAIPFYDAITAPTPVLLPGWARGLAHLLGAIPGVGEHDVPRAPRLVAFGAEHSVADLAVSAHDPLQTAARLTAAAAFSGPLGEAAAGQQVPIRTVDLTSTGGTILTRAGRIDVEDGLADHELTIAFQAGRDAADAEVDAGADLLIAALVSVAVSTPAAALAAHITGLEPVDTTDRGSGISDAAWIRKAAAVRDALFRARGADPSVEGLLRSIGGADLAALTGFLARAAARRTPVLVDDVPGTVCAVLAQRLSPGAQAWFTVATLQPGQTHRRLLDVLGAEALVGWGLPVSGCGALAVLPAIRATSAALLPTGEPRTAEAIDRWDPELH